MATKKDLVEAHSFSKRRLVTAFVSGAPGRPRGRAGPPGPRAHRRHRALGAAARRRGDRGLPDRPPQLGVARARQLRHLQGDRRAVRRPARRRRPAAPARPQLPLGPAAPRGAGARPPTGSPTSTSARSPSAPTSASTARPTLPAAADLIDDGWTACTAAGSGVQARPSTAGPAGGRAGGLGLPGPQRRRAVARRPGVPGGRRLPASSCPPTPTDAGVHRRPARLRGTTSAARACREEWLNLFPRGRPLDAESFGVTGDGSARPTTPAPRPTCPASASATSCDTADGRSYLLGRDGPHPAQRVRRGRLRRGGLRRPGPRRGPARSPRPTPTYPAEWPRRHARRRLGPRAVCGAPPRRRRARRRGGARRQPDRAPRRPTEVGPRSHEVDVAPAGGAYVRSGADDAATDGTPYVIDTKGQKYALIGPTSPCYIGYGDSAAPVVPNTWLEFFERGRRAVGQRRPAGARGRAGDRGRRGVMTGTARAAGRWARGGLAAALALAPLCLGATATGVRRRGRRVRRRRARRVRGAGRHQGADQRAALARMHVARGPRDHRRQRRQGRGRRQRHPAGAADRHRPRAHALPDVGRPDPVGARHDRRRADRRAGRAWRRAPIIDVEVFDSEGADVSRGRSASPPRAWPLASAGSSMLHRDERFGVVNISLSRPSTTPRSGGDRGPGCARRRRRGRRRQQGPHDELRGLRGHPGQRRPGLPRRLRRRACCERRAPGQPGPAPATSCPTWTPTSPHPPSVRSRSTPPASVRDRPRWRRRGPRPRSAGSWHCCASASRVTTPSRSWPAAGHDDARAPARSRTRGPAPEWCRPTTRSPARSSQGRSGKVERSTRSDAMAPPAPERVDLFGSSRALLLWFGLLGGALLALVFILLPSRAAADASPGECEPARARTRRRAGAWRRIGGFEPPRAINPTRFPSERHRPLGESSAEEATGRSPAGEIARRVALVRCDGLP